MEGWSGGVVVAQPGKAQSQARARQANNLLQLTIDQHYPALISPEFCACADRRLWSTVRNNVDVDRQFEQCLVLP